VINARSATLSPKAAIPLKQQQGAAQFPLFCGL
jgi:hypothetical protein